MTLISTFSDSIKRGETTWNVLKKNWVISLTNKFVLIFFVLSVALLALYYRVLPPEVPLWFSKPWGADRLAHPLWLILLPGGSVIWYGMNRIFAIVYLDEYLVFTQTLFLSSLLVSFLSFVTLVNIIFLVT